jgi:hypothetical protein
LLTTSDIATLPCAESFGVVAPLLDHVGGTQRQRTTLLPTFQQVVLEKFTSSLTGHGGFDGGSKGHLSR